VIPRTVPSHMVSSCDSSDHTLLFLARQALKSFPLTFRRPL